MPSARPPHNAARINAQLRRAACIVDGRVQCEDEVDSTNRMLLDCADAHARAVLAERQTAGRGRRGRKWRDAKSAALLMSLGWRIASTRVDGLSLACGVACIDALRALNIDAIDRLIQQGALGLKWPNDLLLHGKKLGGVLVEVRNAFAVIGVGVNVSSSPSVESVESNGAAPINFADADIKIDRDELAAALIIAQCNALQQFCQHGFAAFADRWRALHCLQNKRVRVHQDNETFYATVCGADKDGALLINRDGNQQRIVSANASLRAVE